MSEQNILLYVGSYAEKEEAGVHVYSLNCNEGTFTAVDHAAGMKNPTFVNVDAAKRKLYAIAETTDVSGERSGEVITFDITQEGQLKELSRATTIQPTASHIQRDRNSKYLIFSGYHGGNVGLVSIDEQGEAGKLVDEQVHHGHGADPSRQDRPHPHSTLATPDNKYVLVADLGLDLVKVYALDQAANKLVFHSEAATPPGAGPRHMTFHPNGKFVYSINEVNSTITAFAYDDSKGQLTTIETVSTLPVDFSGENLTAEIAITPDGLNLYGSNRGHDSLVHFKIDVTTGKLTLIGHVSTEGGHPRHFAVTPTGKHLIVANRDSNNLTLFTIDDKGTPSYTGHSVTVSKPVCVQPIIL